MLGLSGGIGGILTAQGWDPVVVSFYRSAIGCFLFSSVWLGDSGQIRAVLSTPRWPLFVVLGALGVGLSFIFYIVGVNHTAPSVAAIVAMVEPVTASLLGVVVLNESLAALQVFGMGLILVTVTALSIYSSAQNVPHPTNPLTD